MELVFVRHGESVGNVERRLQGHADYPLSALGREQASHVAIWLKSRKLVFNQVYASPLSRASETADVITAELGLAPAERLDDLREVHVGNLERKNLSEIQVEFPSFLKRGLEGLGDFSEFGGESYDELQVRCARLTETFFGRHKESRERILIVAHGGINFQLVKSLICVPVPRVAILRMGNCTATMVGMRDRRGVVIGEVGWHVPVELMGSPERDENGGGDEKDGKREGASGLFR
jgi:2,3-bisphosphoglycerate-dependent phosphoglycerate mutase